MTSSTENEPKQQNVPQAPTVREKIEALHQRGIALEKESQNVKAELNALYGPERAPSPWLISPRAPASEAEDKGEQDGEDDEVDMDDKGEVDDKSDKDEEEDTDDEGDEESEESEEEQGDKGDKGDHKERGEKKVQRKKCKCGTELEEDAKPYFVNCQACRARTTADYNVKYKLKKDAKKARLKEAKKQQTSEKRK
jgi:hypothetical protein